MPKCKFYKNCIHYRESSYTCNSGGSHYCGKYREFDLVKSNNTILNFGKEFFIKFFFFLCYNLFHIKKQTHPFSIRDSGIKSCAAQGLPNADKAIIKNKKMRKNG